MQITTFTKASGKVFSLNIAINRLYAALRHNRDMVVGYHSLKALQISNSHHLAYMHDYLETFFREDLNNPDAIYGRVLSKLPMITNHLGLAYLNNSQSFQQIGLGSSVLLPKTLDGEIVKVVYHDSTSLLMDDYLMDTTATSIILVDLPQMAKQMAIARVAAATNDNTSYNRSTFLTNRVLLPGATNCIDLAVLNLMTQLDYESISSRVTLPYQQLDVDKVYSKVHRSLSAVFKGFSGTSGDFLKSFELPFSVGLPDVDIEDLYSDSMIWYNVLGNTLNYDRLTYWDDRFNLKLNLDPTIKRLRVFLTTTGKSDSYFNKTDDDVYQALGTCVERK